MDSRQTQFEALVRAYSPDLYRYALWLVRNRAQAEDLVQETLLRAWRSLDGLRDPAAAKRWLITILRNERARAFGEHRLENGIRMEIEIQTVDDEQGRPEILALRHALALLPEEYREPLLMQVVGGFSCDEIAETLGIQPGAVMTRLCRARQRMRQALLSEDEFSRIEVRA